MSAEGLPRDSYQVARYIGLEELAAQWGQALPELLDEHVAARGQLLDQEFELAFPVLAGFTDRLACLLMGGPADDDARETAYYGLHFGWLLANQLIGPQATLEFGGYYEVKPIEWEQLRTRIQLDSQAYLSTRQTLDALVGRYMPEIDRSGRYPYLAETISALILMHIDNFERKKFIDEQVANFALSIPSGV